MSFATYLWEQVGLPGRGICRSILVVSAGLAVWVTPLSAGFRSPLESLAEKVEGRAVHVSSADRTGGNGDMIHLAPGETATLLDYQGAGCIRRFWMTIAPRADRDLHSEVILRMYWDGDTQPSVECPIGAFFGVGFGESRDYVSLPLSETSGGYNCYWPMPFAKSARWTLTNRASKPVTAFYYNIDLLAQDALPTDTRRFHAQFRRENPTDPQRNYTILDVQGDGHYVGTALFMSGRALYFLEGDEMVQVDGEEKPSIQGTGAEDYFNSGWYYDRGPFSAPYHGLILKDDQRISTYRWHIEDPIPFRRSLRFTIEHGTNNGIPADYSSVAYFYLAGPAPQPPPLPADLLPSKWDRPKDLVITGAIEAEDLHKTAHATDGNVWEQDMGNWDYGQAWSKRRALFWMTERTGAALSMTLPAGGSAARELVALMVTGPTCGIVNFSLNGHPAGTTVDLYAETMGVREISLGPVPDATGGLKLTVSMTGKNPAATHFGAGLDAFLFRP